MAKKKKGNIVVRVLDGIAMGLTAIGSMNWGLKPLNVNVVNALLKSVPVAETITYVAVGVSGAYLTIKWAVKKFG